MAGSILKTARLELRRPTPSDAPRLVELMQDPAIAWNTARIPYPFSQEHADAFLARATAGGDARVFAIILGKDLVGMIGLHKTDQACPQRWAVGYWMDEPYRGKGLMTEALRAVVAYARDELAAHAVVAGQFSDNPASAAVLKKAGFSPTGETVMTMSRGRGREVETVNYRIELRRL